MFRRAFWALGVVVCLAMPVAVQAQGDYLDVYTVKVKPEKVADFNAVAKKMVEANRRYNGDHWLTMETTYGEGDTFVFVSTRQDYADIDKANDAFMNALNKAYGKEAAEKMLHDWESCVASSRTEFRGRRQSWHRGRGDTSVRRAHRSSHAFSASLAQMENDHRARKVDWRSRRSCFIDGQRHRRTDPYPWRALASRVRARGPGREVCARSEGRGSEAVRRAG
jgi:quinol monooxygenase YgiN